MSVGPMSAMNGVIGSAAGAPKSQSASDVERGQKDSSAKQRQVKNDAKAEQAAGIGKTESDSGPSERDADGRKLWEGPASGPGDKKKEGSQEPPHQAKDPTGQSGGTLDLTG